jgi:hypothetical protein
VELLPLASDHLMGDSPIFQLAEVLVTLGRYDEAIDRLEQLITIPSMFVSVPTLRSAPMWKPLRGHSRFEDLLAGRG